MKKLILFYLSVSGLIFYSINSNSSLLKEKFEVSQNVEIPEIDRIATAENDFLPVSSSTDQPKFFCLKADNCYYCQLNNKTE